MDQNQNNLDRQELIAENERLDDKVRELEESVQALHTCIIEQRQEISAQKQARAVDSAVQEQMQDQLEQERAYGIRMWNQLKSTMTRRQPPHDEAEQV